MFEVAARFDELFERRYPSTTAESAALVDRICSSSRAENRAAAEQLAAIGDLLAYRLTRCSDTEAWAIDTEEAVAAELAAALRIGQGLAASRLRYARAMRERLPKVAEVFKAGDIDCRMFQTIVYRTDLITDRESLAAVDAELAVKVPRWPSMTLESVGRAGGQDRGQGRCRRGAAAQTAPRRSGDLDRGCRRRDVGDPRQPVQPRCACSGQAIECAGGHGL